MQVVSLSSRFTVGRWTIFRSVMVQAQGSIFHQAAEARPPFSAAPDGCEFTSNAVHDLINPSTLPFIEAIPFRSSGKTEAERLILNHDGR